MTETQAGIGAVIAVLVGAILVPSLVETDTVGESMLAALAWVTGVGVLLHRPLLALLERLMEVEL